MTSQPIEFTKRLYIIHIHRSGPRPHFEHISYTLMRTHNTHIRTTHTRTHSRTHAPEVAMLGENKIDDPFKPFVCCRCSRKNASPKPCKQCRRRPCIICACRLACTFCQHPRQQLLKVTNCEGCGRAECSSISRRAVGGPSYPQRGKVCG
jgi:hypothetical protein